MEVQKRSVLTEQSGSFSNRHSEKLHQLTVSKRCGRLGVTCCNNPHGSGVLIEKLAVDTMLWSQGVNVGDVVQSINGSACVDHEGAVATIDEARDMVTFELSGLTRRLVVDKALGRVGITVANRAGGRGVEVTELVPDGAADRAGVRMGDVLVSVDGGLVETHEQAIERVDGSAPRFEMVVLLSDRDSFA